MQRPIPTEEPHQDERPPSRAHAARGDLWAGSTGASVALDTSQGAVAELSRPAPELGGAFARGAPAWRGGPSAVFIGQYLEVDPRTFESRRMEDCQELDPSRTPNAGAPAKGSQAPFDVIGRHRDHSKRTTSRTQRLALRNISHERRALT